MKTFIASIAELLLTQYKDELRDVLVVFPNRRPAVFLREELSRQAEKGIWMPEILSIDDFVFRQTGFRQADNVELLLDLFAVHQQVELNEKQGFDRFAGWARTLLSDFNELDLYLADHQIVFRYLEDAKNIAKWRADGSSLSELEKSYVAFFGSLKAYYAGLREHMLSKNAVWQGLAYRSFAEQPETYCKDLNHVVFAGFNALTPAEHKVMYYLRQHYSAQVLWDADHYYLDDHMHEAGHFMRQNLKTYPGAHNWIVDAFKEPKNVTLHAVAGSVAQVKLAGSLLQDDLVKGIKMQGSTALVLPDEELLIPLLSSVPGRLAYNVTMSLPLKNSLSYKWIVDVLDYSSDSRNRLQDEKPAAYVPALLEQFQHPVFQDILEARKQNANTLLQEVRASGLLHINQAELEDLLSADKKLSKLLQLFFLRQKETKILLSLLIRALEDLQKHYAGSEHSRIEKEVSSRLMDVLTVISDLVRQSAFELTLRNVRTLFQHLVSLEAIPFKGEPLEGIQIMGMLESRNLDFDNLIVLSVNEGVLPATTPYQSFLLFELRRELGLPLPREKDDVFAYHFYRMLQRAKNIHLVYNTETDAMGAGEASRYIKQMLFEFEKKTGNKIQGPLVYNPGISLAEPDEIRVEKTPDMLKALLKRFEKGFSASSLSQYAHCQLQFFYSKVLGIRETEQIEEVIPPNVLGSIVHDSLEAFYKPYSGNVLSAEILKTAFGRLDKVLEENVAKHYSSRAIKLGKNILLEQVVRKLLENVYQEDLRAVKKGDLIFVGAEDEYKRVLQVQVGDDLHKIPFYGIIDRLDKAEHLRFVDYKTGKVEEYSLKVTTDSFYEDFAGEEKPARKMAFQLLMYAWLHNAKEPFEASIMNLKKSARHMPLQVDGKKVIEPSVLEGFEDTLKQILAEMLDMKRPFVQTPHKKHCTHCEFNSICQRNQ